MEAAYVPLTITYIGDWAFDNCASLRFFYLPEEIEHIGKNIVDDCHRLLTTVKYEYDDDGDREILNSEEVNEWLMQ